jgi:DNA-binding MarR family transcriptional regulator
VLAAGGCAVTALADPADQPPVVLLVRLHPRLPSGAVVGESQRVCHLVPVPRPSAVPEVLSAYCGVVIAPGTAELLTAISGMPCEPCLAQSRIPAFAMLRGQSTAASEPDSAWWADRVPGEQQAVMVLALLYLLQEDGRPISLSELIALLGVDSATLTVVLWLYEVAELVSCVPSQAEEPTTEPRYQLTDRGHSVAPQVLAHSHTPALVERAARLGPGHHVHPEQIRTPCW